MVDLTVSIVNWNTKDELRECLTTVLSQVDITFEVIVSDNASSDDSVDMIKGEFTDRVTLLQHSQNIGFGAAHNIAIQHSRGRYVFLLNPDSRLLDTNALAEMMRFMDDHKDVGMLGPKIIDPDGTIQFSARRFPSMFAGIFRHTLFGKLFPQNHFVRDYLMTDWKHNEVADVGWLSGAALFVRRETLAQIGLLDERFFMYCEDVDWCKRAHSADWRVVYFPMTTVSHRIGAASDQNPIPMIRQHHRSMLRYFLKYNSSSPRILLLPLVLIALWLRARSLINRAKP